ncbi:MAG TPA: hypothetical protein VJ728_06205 [Candidatus Binataceae bacterium]|nr:hypothetical protein [Candidatus Binataceae bacterium]
MAAFDLLRRGYPNDEARLVLWWKGFPIEPAKVRTAWASRLGKLDLELKSKTDRALRQRGAPFSAIEDEISEIVLPFVRELAQHTGLDRESLIQLSIDLFGLTFRRGFVVDTSVLDYLRDLIIAGGIAISDMETLSDADFVGIKKFIQTNMIFAAVQEIISKATDAELIHAHRRWRQMLKLASDIFPELRTDKTFAQLLAAGFGRICLPAIIQLVRDGNSPKIDLTLQEIRSFATAYDARGIMIAGIYRKPVGTDRSRAFFDLIRRISRIWDYSGFPLSAEDS